VLSVGKFVSANHPIYNYYYWKWFSCRDSACDTLFRDDTSSAITNVEIIQDTIRFSNGGWLGYTALITKLTDDELVLKFLEISPWFRHYRRNHRTLVTKGTGANTGIDSVEYHE